MIRPGGRPMATPPLRIALIGAGLFGRHHIGILSADPGFVLCGIADPAPESRALAARLGVPWSAHPEEILDAQAPDGAIVATPNALHVPHGLSCLARGIPALVEKPVADTPEGGLALAEAAEASGVPLLVGHHRRHNPILETAREAIAAGRIGRPVAASINWLIRKPDDYFDAAWRREPGGGPVMINLVHEVDALRFLLGEVAEVQAMTSSATRGFAVEDTATVLLRLAGGMLATVAISDAAASPWNWEQTSGENPAFSLQPADNGVITGTEGGLSLPHLELWRHDPASGLPPGWNAPMVRERLSFAPDDPYRRQLRHFGRVIRGEEPPRVTARDATRSLSLCFAVLEAARNGRRIAVAED